MKRTLTDLARKTLDAFGLDIVRKGHRRQWDVRMRQARDLGFAPQTILDGGAFRGAWAREAAALFPGAQIVLVEPNPALIPIIAGNVEGITPAPKIVEAALGEKPGTASFHIWQEATNDQGASLLDHVSGDANQVVEVEVDTLDAIAARLDLKPDLLKLDLQGAEGPALEGGEAVLRSAEFVVVEFGCLEAYVDRTTPRQLIDKLYDSGFCLYDVVDLHDRPHDGALTGGDFFFVKNTSRLRRHKGYV